MSVLSFFVTATRSKASFQKFPRLTIPENLVCVVGLAGFTLALGHIQPSCGRFKQPIVQMRHGFVGVTNERWLRWAVSRHLRIKGFEVNMTGVKAGNAALDGELVRSRWRMAFGVKSGRRSSH